MNLSFSDSGGHCSGRNNWLFLIPKTKEKKFLKSMVKFNYRYELLEALPTNQSCIDYLKKLR